jgi:MFS family permease
LLARGTTRLVRFARGFSALFLLGLYDELWSGVAVVAAPDVEEKHALGHAGYTFWIFALPLLLSALIEAPLALYSDRLGRRRVLALCTLGLGSSLVLGGVAHAPWLFALALALAGAASGAACAAAQGELVASSALGSARAMSRWSAFAALGDALVPFFVAGLTWLGLGYRGALLALGVALLAQGLVSAFGAAAGGGEHPSQAEDAAEHVSLRALSLALRARPRLLRLLLASSLCCLLDEVVVALAALRFRQDLDQGLTVTALGSTLIALGSLLGAVLTERALAHVSVRRILLLSSALCGASLLSLASTQALPLSLALLTILGLSAAPHHALVQAAAYEEAPGSPGLVNAVLQLFVVVEIGGPIAVGVVASAYGLVPALLFLGVQPLVIAWVALGAMRARPP